MFCNINFNLTQKNEIFTINKNDINFIITVNAQLIVIANNNERFFNILNNNLTTFDGEIPFKLAKLKKEYKNAVALKGSEIIYDFVDFASENKLKFFLLGGNKDSNEKSVKILQNKYKINADGFSPEYENYPFSDFFVDECLNKIEVFKPDILFVGFGAPKQEFFIDDNINELKKYGVKYVVGCGGTFEFFSGNIKRSPKIISKIGLESFYRLLQQFNMQRINRIFFSFKFFKYIFKEPDFFK